MPPLGTDSALGDSDASVYSESLRSSIYNYRYENGRRYHAYKEGAYLNPDDEVEQDRLDRLHQIWKMMLNGKLYMAPLARDLQTVLDVGTGTGKWAIEVADQHPSARVVGTDLSPMQPTWVPPNCSFYIDDVSNEWLFNEKFDFIHARALSGAIADWSAFFREVKHNLKPGGWVEMQDHQSPIESEDDSLDRSQWTADWAREINRGSEEFGKSLKVAHKYAEWIHEAGFEDVHEKTVKVPIGTWAEDSWLKEMGELQLPQMLRWVEAFTLALFTRVLNISPDRTQEIVEGVKSELLDTSNRFYVMYRFVAGRKPSI